MFKQSKKAFTLVELIVVITILAILGTIAFISLQGYSKSARDSRRISDVNNVKTSLELFILNAGKYPLPDSGEEVLYSGGLLWTQGIVGDVVTRNLSKNLPKKPLDPLTETEYIYSVTNTQKEFEVLTYYEGTQAYNNTLNIVNAAINYTPKISGTYNGVFLKTSTTIVPTPSIINAEIESGGLTLNATNIQSQIISGGENFPDINNQLTTGKLDINLSTAAVITDDSSDDAKLLAIEAIQNAYSGTSLASNYEYILSKTEDEDKLDLVETVILNNNSSVNSNFEEVDLCPSISSSIISYWKFDDTATDSEGSNHGSIQGGATWTTGKVGNALEFDGVDDYVELSPTSLDGLSEFTIGGWIKLDSHATTSQTPILVDRNASNFDFQFIVMPNDSNPNKLLFSLYTDSDSDGASGVSASDININEWTYVTATYNGSEVRVYINGLQDGSIGYITGNLLSTSDDMRLGGDVFSNNFDGLMDEFSIFDRALSDEEILKIYEDGNGGETVCGN